VQSHRQLYENVFQRLKEMDMASQLRPSGVFVIEPAEPPLAPSSPRVLRSLILAVALGVVGGLGLAFAADALDSTFRSSEEIERHLGLASLGIVPDMRALASAGRAATRRLLPEPDAHGMPRSSGMALGDLRGIAWDAYRTLRSNIMLSQAGEAPRVILFTSASRAEGKTATALNTAMNFTQTGARVLVIDADLRSPRCHDALGIELEPGLTEVITGQVALEWALREPAGSLVVLTAGQLPPNPAELLGSPRMRELLAQLREQFDHVLIDAAPLLPVPDSLILSTFADGVIIVVDQQRTRRQQVRAVQSRLAFARARTLGVVLNRFDHRYLQDELQYG
jgi:capsular exopolysaccharide synthesis family protein